MVRKNEVGSSLSGVNNISCPALPFPPNETVSRAIGEETGCNRESRALANTGAAPALTKKASPDSGAD
jgi:hypothetical protein